MVLGERRTPTREEAWFIATTMLGSHTNNKAGCTFSRVVEEGLKFDGLESHMSRAGMAQQH